MVEKLKEQSRDFTSEIEKVKSQVQSIVQGVSARAEQNAKGNKPKLEDKVPQPEEVDYLQGPEPSFRPN